jgi:DNA-binding Lrp family transcriptional regulator
VYGQQEIYAPIVTQAIENVTFNPWGVISRHFELRVSDLCRVKSSANVSSVLIALATGTHRVADLVNNLGLKQSQVTVRINALLGADIIEKNGNYYHIKDKLFRYWIKYVYEHRLKAIDMEPGRARKQFKEEINKAVNDFQVVTRKDLSTRVADLMYKFDNESFDLSGRRYKLSSFQKVVPLKLRMASGNYFDAIQAQGEDGGWLVVIKKDPLHDNDLSGIIEEMKKLNPRPQRCVIVPLNGLDDSAKIRALQEKLWIWNEDELNMLMHLYDEPYIVR